ncbi:hypothetical protein ACROYT_G039629 [Oculina patagonica]
MATKAQKKKAFSGYKQLKTSKKDRYFTTGNSVNVSTSGPPSSEACHHIFFHVYDSQGVSCSLVRPNKIFLVLSCSLKVFL